MNRIWWLVYEYTGTVLPVSCCHPRKKDKVNKPYLYHQQISEGNLIPNIEAAYSEIGAFHLGDNPGRKEPTSGEINYKNIFKYLYNKGYNGTLCMEHGKSLPGKEGEERVIAAYRECDAF